MASRNFAQVAPTSATIALNAYIFGYGGHSLVTPHTALKRLWWTDERIEAKVTRAFVISKLRGEERGFLDRPLAFGEGLTDDTYMEWILHRATRLFLILTEIGVPDQIFGCIDDSWDDDDLPIALENVPYLDLSLEPNEQLNRKFYDTQFIYLLRELRPGSHIDYGPTEHIPMEHVNTLPPAVAIQLYDRVHFPGRPEEVYLRRKFSLVDKETGQSYRDAFTRDIRKAKVLRHQHIATTWASYSSSLRDAAFVLSDFVAEHTLGTFIDHRIPTQFLRLPAPKRPILLLEWMHCLSDALAFLHHVGVAHTQIRPSNIWVDHENRIAFADVGSLPTFQHGKRAPKTEAYDYAAPEQPITKTPLHFRSARPPPLSSAGAFSKLRKMSTFSTSDVSSSTSGSSRGSSPRSSSISHPSPAPPTPRTRSNSFTSPSYSSPTAIDTNVPCLSHPRSPSNLHNPSSSFSSISSPLSPTTITTTTDAPVSPLSPTSSSSSTFFPASPGGPTVPHPASLRDLPAALPEMSDIYSLACIFLDLLTFALRGKLNDFVRFRSRSSSSSSSSTKTDNTSFHAEPERIAAWIDLLEEDSYRHSEPVFRGFPELLRLVRLMMVQNATLRPAAHEVRDRLRRILHDECGLTYNGADLDDADADAAAAPHHLCCDHRPWPDVSAADLLDPVPFKSPFRRGGVAASRSQHGSAAHYNSGGNYHNNHTSRNSSNPVEGTDPHQQQPHTRSSPSSSSSSPSSPHSSSSTMRPDAAADTTTTPTSAVRPSSGRRMSSASHHSVSRKNRKGGGGDSTATVWSAAVLKSRLWLRGSSSSSAMA